MKRDRIDEILSTIDAGLQSTPEASYGETPWDGARPADSVRLCVRCDDAVGPDGEICPGCRTFLLGDTDDDPAQHRQRWAPAGALPAMPDFGVDHETFVAQLAERAQSFGEAMAALGEALVEALRPIGALFGIIENEDDPLDDAALARLRQLVLDFDPATLIEDVVLPMDLEVGEEITIEEVPWIVLERLPDDPQGIPCYRLGPPPDEIEP